MAKTLHKAETTPTLPATFRTWFSIYASSVLSARAKRFVFMSSITGLIYEYSDPDMSAMRRINTILMIARHPEACLVPYRARSLIWRNRNLEVVGTDKKPLHLYDVALRDLTGVDYIRLATTVVHQSPRWLVYASKDQMKLDVFKLFTQARSISLSGYGDLS